MKAIGIVLLGCMSMQACVAQRPYPNMVCPVDSKHVQVSHTKPEIHDGKVEIAWLEIHATGDARIEEATLTIFSDRNANGAAEVSELVHTLTGRPSGAGDISVENLAYPDLPMLTASIRVRTSEGDPVETTWLLVTD